MTNSTPFNNWSLEGEPDPFGNYYGEDYENLFTLDEIVENMTCGYGMLIVTYAKDLLRYLSRELARLSDDHEAINIERATLSCGELTDDQLANAFYLYETYEYLQAGRERIIWLQEKINLCDDISELTKDQVNLLIERYSYTYCPFSVAKKLPPTVKQDTPKHYKSSSRSKFKKRSRNNKRK